MAASKSTCSLDGPAGWHLYVCRETQGDRTRSNRITALHSMIYHSSASLIITSILTAIEFNEWFKHLDCEIKSSLSHSNIFYMVLFFSTFQFL